MLAGLMALATLGAGAILDVGSSTAEAAKSASPFAGTYAGAPPMSTVNCQVTISNKGQITGRSIRTRVITRASGEVRANGRYSMTVTRSVIDRESGLTRVLSSSSSAGNMALDAAGNLVGAVDGGGSFTWLRQ
jgi:hypothetical protein